MNCLVRDCVRIISGDAKGTRLKTPKGMKTRPTADRVKESVFGILGGKIEDSVVLDLFSGSGALGLEALSRGAAIATLVDKSAESVKIIKENAELTKMDSVAKICREDVFQAVKRLANDKAVFDLIFCDPPYNLGLAPKAVQALDACDLLSERGVLVLEHSRHENLPGELKRIAAYRSEFYGETVVSFFRKQEGI